MFIVFPKLNMLKQWPLRIVSSLLYFWTSKSQINKKSYNVIKTFRGRATAASRLLLKAITVFNVFITLKKRVLLRWNTNHVTWHPGIDPWRSCAKWQKGHVRDEKKLKCHESALVVEHIESNRQELSRNSKKFMHKITLKPFSDESSVWTQQWLKCDLRVKNTECTCIMTFVHQS